MQPALTLTDVGCARGDRLLFSGVSASVDAGGLLHVRGANGAGKTTLLRTICGLSVPTEGAVAWHGGAVAALRETGSIVYLGHAPALKGDLSALENLQADCALAGQQCSTAQASAALARAGLRGRDHLPVRLLSQGQRKRAALARLATAAASTGLWVLDEPFDALDVAAFEWLQRLIGAQSARGGVVVLTSHQEFASAFMRLPMAIDLDAHAASECAA